MTKTPESVTHVFVFLTRIQKCYVTFTSLCKRGKQDSDTTLIAIQTDWSVWTSAKTPLFVLLCSKLPIPSLNLNWMIPDQCHYFDVNYPHRFRSWSSLFLKFVWIDVEGRTFHLSLIAIFVPWSWNLQGIDLNLTFLITYLNFLKLRLAANSVFSKY